MLISTFRCIRISNLVFAVLYINLLAAERILLIICLALVVFVAFIKPLILWLNPFVWEGSISLYISGISNRNFVFSLLLWKGIICVWTKRIMFLDSKFWVKQNAGRLYSYSFKLFIVVFCEYCLAILCHYRMGNIVKLRSICTFFLIHTKPRILWEGKSWKRYWYIDNSSVKIYLSLYFQ